jgi:glycosyltransferase involved in cell wall biosynthesis
MRIVFNEEGFWMNIKKISVVVPCYNDSASVAQMHERVKRVFDEQLPSYDYQITFCDDRSPDGGKTWSEIKKVCASDPKCRGVRNVRNFGAYRNSFIALRQYANGDATFQIFGDLQDPPEYLPELVKLWEQGHKVVLGLRPNQYYNLLFMGLRKIYYSVITTMSGNRQFEGANGYGLYDKNFIAILNQIDDMQPTLPGIAAEYGEELATVTIHQEKGGRLGKSNLRFWGKYDAAMVVITSYTKYLLRIIVFVGLVVGALSLAFAVYVFILKLIKGDAIPIGIPSLTIGMSFLGAVQLFFLGIIGEYILAINNRSMKRPLTAAAERVGFEDENN